MCVSGFVCVCVYVSNLWQFSTRSWDSLGESQKITPCSHITPSSPSLLSYPLPHHLPSLKVRQLLHQYMAPKCYSSLVFETPFHFSPFSRTCDNGLLSLHKASSVTHSQTSTPGLSATSDSQCVYDSPNAPFTYTAILLSSRHSPPMCNINTGNFPFYCLRIDITVSDWKMAKMANNGCNCPRRSYKSVHVFSVTYWPHRRT